MKLSTAIKRLKRLMSSLARRSNRARFSSLLYPIAVQSPCKDAGCSVITSSDMDLPLLLWGGG